MQNKELTWHVIRLVEDVVDVVDPYGLWMSVCCLGRRGKGENDKRLTPIAQTRNPIIKTAPRAIFWRKGIEMAQKSHMGRRAAMKSWTTLTELAARRPPGSEVHVYLVPEAIHSGSSWFQ